MAIESALCIKHHQIIEYNACRLNTPRQVSWNQTYVPDGQRTVDFWDPIFGNPFFGAKDESLSEQVGQVICFILCLFDLMLS